MVRKPRLFAIAINERPTPEFAPFWTTQSPGLRSVCDPLTNRTTEE
jgi:hypothetical protein